MLTAILTKCNDFSEVIISTSEVRASPNHGDVIINDEIYTIKDGASEHDPDNYVLDIQILNAQGNLIRRYA
jgi:hypothetical protein